MRKRITRLALAAAMCTTLVTGNVYASAKVVKVNTDAADTLQEEVDSVTGPAFGVDSDQYDEKIAEAEEAARRQAEEAQREKEEAARQEILEREETARQEALAREEAARQEAQAQEEALVAQEDEEIAALRASMKGKSLGTFKTYAYSLDCDPSGSLQRGRFLQWEEPLQQIGPCFPRAPRCASETAIPFIQWRIREAISKARPLISL